MAEQQLQLLVEVFDSSELNYLIEGEGSAKEKSYKLTGPFIMCEQKNKNGRIYPKSIVKKDLARYVEDFVKRKRAIGNTDHPREAGLRLSDAAILTESMEWDGNIVVGKAKVLSNPNGEFLKSLMRDGVQLGISSRSLGSVNPDGIVNDNLRIIANDIVCEPSAYLAILDSVMESTSWFINDGVITQRTGEIFKKIIDKNGTRNIENDLRNFITTLKSKI